MLPREVRKFLFESRLALECPEEFFEANAGLPQDALESADRDGPMRGNRDAFIAFGHSDMRARLAHQCEAKPL